jgi:dipeptidyl aminopeptidase/acylaminoacyl peptidase
MHLDVDLPRFSHTVHTHYLTPHFTTFQATPIPLLIINTSIMTIKASQFTPEVLLSAPRRSAGVPNANGSYVLFTVSSYSFESHSKTNELRVLDIKSNESTLLLDEAVDGLNWLDEDAFVWLRGKDGGETEVCVGRIGEALKKNASSRDDGERKNEWYSVAGTIAAPASNLKVKKLDGGEEYAVVLSAQANAKGELFNPEKAEKSHSTGRLYTGLYVRHWDAYEDKEKNSLWYGKLSKSDNDNGRFQLSPLTNALKGAKNLECPMNPFGGVDNFDLSPRGGIAFVSKDPDLNPALNTKCNVYLVNVDSWTQAPGAGPKRVIVKGFEGASTAPVFSPDGSHVAFLSQKRNGYESDQNRIFVLGDLEANKLEASCEHGLVASQTGWDRSPSSIAWSSDGKALFVTAEDEGHAKIFEIRSGQQTPYPLTKKGSVGDVVPLEKPGEIFYTGSSLIDNSTFAIIEISLLEPLTTWSHSNSNHGNKFGLKEQQVSSIWTPPSNPKINKKVHSWIVKPSNFDSSKKYPVAYLIHGGPQGAWGDSWSTRWNPAVFAEQGFIVITPNITGSTGYGQAFTDAINKNWGGDPYVDIENLFEWVGKHLPEADNERAVALGASYGGYMMNCKCLDIPPEPVQNHNVRERQTNQPPSTTNRDPRPPPRPQIPRPRLPRRHLQHLQHALHRRALLPPLRLGRNTVGSHRLFPARRHQPPILNPIHLRHHHYHPIPTPPSLQRHKHLNLAPLGPLRAPLALGHATAGHSQFEGL